MTNTPRRKLQTPRRDPQGTLRDLRVIVTRATHQAEPLISAFVAAGADVVPLPLLEVVPETGEEVRRAASQATSYKAWIFTSSNAVEAFLPHLSADAAPTFLAAVGPATAIALRRQDFTPHLVAQRSHAEGLLAELLFHLEPGDRALLPQAEDAGPTLAEGLERAGVEVGQVVAYRKRLPTAAVRQARHLFAHQPLGWITFTSPRIVRHFVKLLGEDWSARQGELRAVSIGPVTSRELRNHGVEPAAEAEHPEPKALVRAVINARCAHSLSASDLRNDSG